jgi:DNA invertase Pin-like site-specific DNA recombinase
VASSNGLDVVERFSDSGISAGTGDRPGYQALLAAARGSAFDVIVVEDVSRLWRNRATYGVDSADLEDAGVHLLTAVGDDTRRDGYGLVLGIKQAIAESQRREVSYRTRRALEGLALAGKPTGALPYGYAPGQDDLVATAFRMRQAGAGLGAIADALTALAPAPRGGAWSRSTVKYLLANPRYAGKAIFGRTAVTGGARDSRLRRRVSRPEGPVVTRDVAPLVDPRIWGACNRDQSVV